MFLGLFKDTFKSHFVLENILKSNSWDLDLIFEHFLHASSAYLGPQSPQFAVPEPIVGRQCPHLVADGRLEALMV